MQARLIHAGHRDTFNKLISEKNDVVDLMATTIKRIEGIEDCLFILGKPARDVDLKSRFLIVENKKLKQASINQFFKKIKDRFSQKKYGRCK